MMSAQNSYISLLNKYRDKTFYIIPYIGNSGDELILKGNRQLLSDIHIKTTEERDKAEIMLWSGGNLTMWRHNIKQLARMLSSRPDLEFIIGPSLIYPPGLLYVKLVNGKLGPIKAIFARDKVSYDYLKTDPLYKGIQIEIAHDAALYLRESQWLNEQKKKASSEYVLAAFRGDIRESVLGKGIASRIALQVIPSSIVDPISSLFLNYLRKKKLTKAHEFIDHSLPLKVCDASSCDFDTFLDTIVKAKEVHTDRLHVMIFAAMLGKPVFAYTTSYGKLEAFYEYSLKDWANIKFVR